MPTPGQIAETTPDKPAAIAWPSGDRITYAELEDRSCRLARFWEQQGLQPGDHVSVWASNVLEYFEIYWAAMRSGLVLTTINRYLTADEGAYILNDSGAKAIVGSGTYQDVISEALCDAPGCTLHMLIGRGSDLGNFVDYEQAVQAASPEPLEPRTAGSIMLYSSGTTGRPKGIKQPPSQTTYEELSNPIAGLMTLFGLDSDIVYLSPAPMYHSAPLAWSLGVQDMGGTVVMMERFEPAEFLAAIEHHSVTATQVVPTMFVRLLKLDEETRSKYDLSSLRFVVHAAAPCPVAVKQQMMDWWGPIIHEYYSGTEGIGVTWATPDQWLDHPGTVGQALIGTIQVCDDEGQVLPPGKVGSVYFVSEGPLFEYHGAPEKTKAARHPANERASTLGDIGYLDEDGFLFLTDRKAFMIISGGVNIYPQEIEDALVLHPAVADAAVFGLPDDEMGEFVQAVVQPAADQEPTPELAEELDAYLRSSIAHYKVPRSIDFRDELPRLPTGKLYKGPLRDEYLAATGTTT